MFSSIKLGEILYRKREELSDEPVVVLYKLYEDGQTAILNKSK